MLWVFNDYVHISYIMEFKIKILTEEKQHLKSAIHRWKWFSNKLNKDNLKIDAIKIKLNISTVIES